ncbi:MAG: hypothetical protein ACRDGL_00445 [Candidatus Limnocylindrales bacterium]
MCSDGGYLAGAAIVSVALLVITSARGGGRLPRLAAAALGLMVSADAGLSGLRIAAFVADPGPAGPLTLPMAGPGPWLVAVGGLLLAAAAGLARARPGPFPAGFGRLMALAIALFVGGWIHLLIVPQHLGESALLGLGFAAAAGTQLALAGLALRGGARTLTATVFVNTAILVLYAYAVLVGLQIDGHEHAVGLLVGAGEPVGALGALAFLAELGAIVLAAVGLSTPASTGAVGQSSRRSSISQA